MGTHTILEQLAQDLEASLLAYINAAADLDLQDMTPVAVSLQRIDRLANPSAKYWLARLVGLEHGRRPMAGKSEA